MPGGPIIQAPFPGSCRPSAGTWQDRLQEIHESRLQVILGLVDADDILEGYAVLVLSKQACLGRAKAHGAPRPALHLTHEEDPHADQKQDRQQVDQDGRKQTGARLFEIVGGAVSFEAALQI